MIPLINTPTFWDNCGVSSVNLEESSTQGNNSSNCDFYNYTITRVWTATDASGNTASESQVITVRDNNAPLFTSTLFDVTVNQNTIPSTTLIAIDNCMQTPLMNFSETITTLSPTTCYNYRKLIEREWITSDVCGNSNIAIQKILVEDDNIAPTFVASSVPANTTLSCEQFSGLIPVNVLAIDNCSGNVAIIERIESTQVANVNDCNHYSYTITRIWTATDASGNTSTVSQLVIVKDNVAPTLSSAPANITATQNNIPIAVRLFSIDNCMQYPNVIVTETTQTLIPPLCYSLHKKITRLWTATDACGNSSTTSQIITVLGMNLTCPADKTLNTNSDAVNNYNCSTLITAADNLKPTTFSDNCDLSVLKYNVMNGTTVRNGTGAIAGVIFEKGTNNVTYSINLPNGQTESCGFKVVINDNEKPRITFGQTNPQVVILDGCVFPSSIPTTYRPMVIDNCSGATLSIVSDVTADVAGCSTKTPMLKYTKLMTRTWMAIDGNGNTSTANQQIYLRDMVAPTAICKSGTSIIVGNISVIQTASVFNNNSSDNCSNVLSFSVCRGANCTNFSPSITFTKAMIPTGQNQVTLPLTLRVADFCNNISTCNTSVILNRLIIHTLSKPNNILNIEPIEDNSQAFVPSDIIAEHGSMKCFPNPFSEDLNLQYNLATDVASVVLKVYDNQGRVVAKNEQGESLAGYYSMRWNLSDLEAGMYHICLELDGRIVTNEKVLLIK
jgi:hypothetical protein